MTAGAVRFCRYAYAPNSLGYCGPDDSRSLLEYGAHEHVDGGLFELARAFEGAWPYLSLIAYSNGIADPLQEDVVEAYWLGNRLLEAVKPAALHAFVEERFAPQLGKRRRAVEVAMTTRVPPHHNFHVFVVYPWVGMLRLGRALEPVRVLDRCRVRWGEVVGCEDDRVLVSSQPLVFDGRALSLGPARVEEAVLREGGLGFIRAIRPGDRISLHWDWVCERLSLRQAAALRKATQLALDAANHALLEPAGSVLH